MHDRRGTARALRVPRLRTFHRGLDPHDERAADERGLPPGRRRLRGGGERARRRLHRGHLLSGRARAARRRLGRDLHRLLRRRGGGARALRRRDPADTGHRPRLSARRGSRGRAARSEVPRSRRRRDRARRPRGRVPARALRAGLRTLARRGLRLGAPRGGGRRRGVGEGRARRARCRPHPPRHPRCRGSRPRARARGAAAGARRLPHLEPAHARGGVPRGASAPAPGRGRRPVLDLHRRSGDVRHRSHPGLRRGAIPRRRARRPATRRACSAPSATRRRNHAFEGSEMPPIGPEQRLLSSR